MLEEREEWIIIQRLIFETLPFHPRLAMEIELTIKNYRCFPDSRPARLTIKPGFTSLIGVNNSGKSALLKFFYEFRQTFNQLCAPQSLVTALKQERDVSAQGVTDPRTIFCNKNDRDIEIHINIPSDGHAAGYISGSDEQVTLVFPKLLILKVAKNPLRFSALLHLTNGEKVGPGFLTVDKARETPAGWGITLSSSKDIIHITNVEKILDALSGTIYIGPFRNALNSSTGQYFDINVGQTFIQGWRTYKTGKLIEHRETIYRLTKDIQRIFDFKEFEINASEDGTTLVIFINGKSFDLFDIGSGISQFIVVLASAAFRNPSYILIDEPELNLHPALQLDFLTTLTSYAREGILFATHNMGLARSSSDTIYSLRKIDEGESELRPFELTTRLPEFLGELSFSGYQELGFDKVLLVEGRTDVRTIQQFLRIWKMDHKLVLLPLGGKTLINASSVAELQEVRRISPNIYALIDSEKRSDGAALEPSREAFVRSCQKVGINVKVLDRRATENYLTDAAIKKVKGPKYRALGEFESLEGVSPNWSKEENWRIAHEMTESDLINTDLGQFLKSLQ